MTRARLLPGLAPGSRCSTGMGPNTAHVRRLAHNGLFGDKCRGWLAEGKSATYGSGKVPGSQKSFI